MIDLHFPRMLAEMVRTMYYEDITKVSELTMRIKEINPLKIKDELINKHLFYEYKMKQFLMALAMGLTKKGMGVLSTLSNTSLSSSGGMAEPSA